MSVREGTYVTPVSCFREHRPVIWEVIFPQGKEAHWGGQWGLGEGRLYDSKNSKHACYDSEGGAGGGVGDPELSSCLGLQGIRCTGDPGVPPTSPTFAHPIMSHLLSRGP